MKNYILYFLVLFSSTLDAQRLSHTWVKGSKCEPAIPSNTCRITNLVQNSFDYGPITDFFEGNAAELKISGEYSCHTFTNNAKNHSYSMIGVGSEKSYTSSLINGLSAFNTNISNVFLLPTDNVQQFGGVENRILIATVGGDNFSGHSCASGNFESTFYAYVKKGNGLAVGENLVNFDIPTNLVSARWTYNLGSNVITSFNDIPVNVVKTTCDLNLQDNYDLGVFKYSDLPIAKNFDVNLNCDGNILRANIKFNPPSEGTLAGHSDYVEHKDVNIDMALKDGSTTLEFNKFYSYLASGNSFNKTFTAEFSKGKRTDTYGYFNFSTVVEVEYI
ncbi:TPA: hypothetical protein ACX6R8_000224 [Photobacterium damselae]|uniref:Fimbrial protein n=1 Tax=Photobacterium damselae subsp. damselae TaxID=85581 RepID=A0AAD3WWN9_PHODD|nr:hypothetical protein [Photobacterium damselae]KAB1182341.1 hypothetical protein F6450_06395 [Photobacterium damselae subsp. damselae]